MQLLEDLADAFESKSQLDRTPPKRKGASPPKMPTRKNRR